ncbi:MAG: hypothetical protein NC402_07350 [Prevotella sp.]|nr:hypothetical protein [Prevotella sp.]MCM1075545.1 hypothetical protein [Ruminococcus sp.]
MREIALDNIHRHLARQVLEHLANGDVIHHRNGIVSYDEAAGLSVCPFEKETPFTVYHDRALHMYINQNKLFEDGEE